jgi:hypothetical protein
MRIKSDMITLEESLLLLQKQGKDSPLTLKQILDLLSGRGRFLLLIFLSLPFCQPIQIPGFSVPFGITICLIGIRILLGKHVWLPKKVLSHQISSPLIQKITKTSLLVIKKIRPWIHPRLQFMYTSRFMQTLNGLILSLLGIILALPLPIPFSNIIAGWSIFLISLGILEDDGLLVFIGYMFTFLTAAFFAFLALSVKSLFN